MEATKEFDVSGLEDAMHLPLVWISMTGRSEEELRLLQEKFNLHPLAIEDVIHRGQRPKVEDYENHMFTVLHSIRFENGLIAQDEIFLFTSEKWLIAIHDDDRQIRDMFEKCIRGGRLRIHAQTIDSLYHVLVDMVVDQYFAVLDEVEDQIDLVETEVAQNPTKEALQSMDEIRRNLIVVRRSVWPAREMIGSIMKGIFPIISDQNMAYFRNIYDHVAQLMDLIESYHARMSGIGELYLESVTASTNQIVKLFTVLATIFLPPTLVASIYGMNFLFIPELGWELGYPFALILMALLTVAPLTLMRLKKMI